MDPEDLEILNQQQEDHSEETSDDPDPDEETLESGETEEDSEDDPDGESSDENSDEDSEDGDEAEDSDDDERIGVFTTDPTFGELKKEAPELFKKYPQLKAIWFSGKALREIFPTVEDAREAVEELTNYRALAEDLKTGDPEKVIDTLYRENTTAGRRFINDFLPTLHRKNREAFAAITGPVLKNMLRAAYNTGSTSKSERLQQAALEIHEFVFGDTEIGKPLANPGTAINDPEKEQLKKERDEILRTRFVETRDRVAASSNRVLQETVESMLGDSLSDWEKRAITREVFETLGNRLANDKAHQQLMASLWKKAEKSNFAREFESRIKTVYLSRCKLEIPAIVKKIRSEALRGKPKVKATPRRTTGTPRIGDGKSGGSRTQINQNEIDWSKTSDRDVLNGKFTLLNGKVIQQ